MGRNIRLIVIGFVWLFASIANADILNAATNLTGEDPNPITGSKGTGTAVLELDTTANTLIVRIDFNNLTSVTTSATIHCCGALGSNLPAATVNLASFPLGETHGSTTFGNNIQKTSDPGMWDNTFLGTGPADAQKRLVAALQDGTAYLAIHTSKFSDGEIRGLLKTDSTIATSIRGRNVRMFSDVPFTCSKKSDRCVIPVYASTYRIGMSGVIVCDARMDFGPITVPDHDSHPNRKIRVVWLLVNGDVQDQTKYRLHPDYGIEITKTGANEPNDQTQDFNKPALDEQIERRFKWNSVRKRKNLEFNYKLNAEWYDSVTDQWKPCGQVDPTISNK